MKPCGQISLRLTRQQNRSRKAKAKGPVALSLSPYCLQKVNGTKPNCQPAVTNAVRLNRGAHESTRVCRRVYELVPVTWLLLVHVGHCLSLTVQVSL